MKAIKLLLTENVDNLGIVGDVVSVRAGYARNYLLPRSLGMQPTAGNVKRLAARRAQVEQELKVLRVGLEATLEKLKGHEITIQRSANEQGILFGGVSQHDISQTLKAEGHEIDDRAVRIGEQIKRLDSYMIPIVLASDLKTEIKLWVVSDKPSEQLGEEGESAVAVAEASEAEVEEKPKKKSKKKSADDGGQVEAKSAEDAGDEEKPKKKGKKKAEKEA